MKQKPSSRLARSRDYTATTRRPRRPWYTGRYLDAYSDWSHYQPGTSAGRIERSVSEARAKHSASHSSSNSEPLVKKNQTDGKPVVATTVSQHCDDDARGARGTTCMLKTTGHTSHPGYRPDIEKPPFSEARAKHSASQLQCKPRAASEGAIFSTSPAM